MKQIWKWVVIVVLTYFAGLATLSWYYFDTTPITIKPATTNYYITANYFNSEEVLTYTLPQVKRLINQLQAGSTNVYVSFFENGSTDETPSLIAAFGQELDNLKVPHSIISCDKMPSQSKLLKRWVRMRNVIPQKRYEFMAALRNMALRPLREGLVPWTNPDLPTKVIFLNDIFYSAEEILTLLDTNQGDYDIVCPLDFYFQFYDILATRDISGYWMSGYYPFTRHRQSQEALRDNQPFPVYSCWNGVAILNGDVITKHQIRFRARRYDYVSGQCECVQSECLLVATDFRQLGYNRILINPAVRLSYEWKYYVLYNLGWVTDVVYWLHSWRFELEGSSDEVGDPLSVGCSMPPYWALESYTSYMRTDNRCNVTYSESEAKPVWTLEALSVEQEFYEKLFNEFVEICII